MFKIFYSLLFFVFLFFFSYSNVFAQGNNFVSVVNPVRGSEFWDTKNQDPVTSVKGEAEILQKSNINATWLIRFDALSDEKIIDTLKSLQFDEKGIFLEVTPSWANAAKVNYRQSKNWHSAGSAFLTGYERSEREKLIDTAFEKFKQTFGYFPLSVGAWWVDSYSLQYMQKKYGIISTLIVADQYTTDNYQIWGQFWSTPYYPSQKDALNPAQTLDTKIPVVVLQWAARDPVNAYGNGVLESTFSVQANDYTDFHKLTSKYFSSLIDTYIGQQLNDFNHIVVGLENSYDWNKYKDEYKNQIDALVKKNKSGKLSILPMKDFSSWYINAFPKLSPTQIIVSDDPLNTDKKSIWFMNPFYRAGLFIGSDGIIFKDIRQYIEGQEEICYTKSCTEVNFATFATRVLDEVTYGHKWVIDDGKISNLKVSKDGEKYRVSYTNQANKQRYIEFLPRDIVSNGKISSIDGAILDATNISLEKKTQPQTQQTSYKGSLLTAFLEAVKFILFLTLACLIPGFVLIRKGFSGAPFLLKLFLSVVIGLVAITVMFYILSLLKLRLLILLYIFTANILFLKHPAKLNIPKVKNWLDVGLIVTVLSGTIFQIIPVFKSGLNFSYGLGFWGPNTHDGVWHIALINQLIKSAPPQNPVFSETVLKNYHFFYDMLVAVTNFISKIPVVDLLFRFYPVVLSLFLGIGIYYLFTNLFKDKLDNAKLKISAIFGLYLVYFAGSFGWIVEFLRERHIGGESAFWANQSVSFNLNPPFAISMLIVIAILQLLINFGKSRSKVLSFTIILLIGTLIGFKSYAAILILLSLFIVSVIKIKDKDFSYLVIFICSVLVSLLIFAANFEIGQSLIVFAPFWFIHSMVDSPDRVGWARLSLAREVGLSSKQWPKFILAESLSLIIFIVGNLGIRIFSFGVLKKFNLIFKDINLFFIAIFSLFSATVPILFIQSGNPWNTIQFFYYFLYTSSIFAGLVISSIFFRLPKVLKYIFISFIFVIAPINAVVTANGYLGPSPHAEIGTKELEGLNFLSKQEDGVVLTYPYDSKFKSLPEPWPLFVYDSTAYVSAFSNKNVFLEDEPQNQILLTDYKKRIIESKDFFLRPSEGVKFLNDNKIKYIYLPVLLDIKIEQPNIKKVFENEEVMIYQTQ